jgi:hypothetical protein
LKAFYSHRRSFWGRLLKQGVANDQTVQRTGWIVFLRSKRRNTKAHQCFNRCTCNRVKSTRFVWQEIKRNRPRLRSGLRQLLIFIRQRTLAGKSVKDRWRINARLQQASLSQNAQWRSQSANVLWRIKPCAEFCSLFAGHNSRSGFKNRNCTIRDYPVFFT